MELLTKEFILNYNTNNTITENYKPVNINSVISHNNLKNFLKQYIDNNDFPNILLHGLPGIGKTCLINACLNELFEDTEYNVMSINASERRGVSMLKDLLTNFLENDSRFLNNNLKIIVLDEMDNLTIEAQNLIKTFMDVYKNVRFVLICNYENKVCESLKCRCFYYKLVKPGKEEIKTLCYKLKTQNITEFIKDYDIYQYPNLVQLLYDIYENITLTPKQIIEFTNLEIMVYKGISYINFYTYLCSLFKS